MSNFTKVENKILLSSMTLEAKGMFALIKYYSKIPNFTLNREYLKKVANVGETAFRRIWSELKKNNLITVTRKRINGKFEWNITLNDTNSDKVILNADTGIKKDNIKSNKKPVESNDCKPIEGQIHTDEVIKENEATESNFDLIQDEYKAIRATKEEIRRINQESKENVTQALNELKKDKQTVTSLKYVLNKIQFMKNNVAAKENVIPFKQFEQREYDYDSLERGLLGWDKNDKGDFGA